MKTSGFSLALLLFVILIVNGCKKQAAVTEPEDTDIPYSGVLLSDDTKESPPEPPVEPDAREKVNEYVYPIHRTNVRIPYGYDDEKNYYGVLSGQDIMHFIYRNDSILAEPGDSSYIWDYYMDTGDLIARTGEDHEIMKNIVLVFVRYLTGDQKPPFFGDREEYNELVILQVENRIPRVIVRMDFGPTLGQISEGGPYGVYEGYTASLIEVSPEASAVNIRYSISDQEDEMEVIESSEEVYIYSVDEGKLKSVLAVDTEDTESDYEGSNSWGWWADLTILESTRNGLYEMVYTKRTWEREDDEMLMEETDTLLYYWNGSAYIQDDL